jgi:glycosidase
MKENIVWYEINPNYFEQLALQKGWISAPSKKSFFELVKDCLNYICALGCTGIWVMPIYERGQLSKKGFKSPYAVREYQIEAGWGSDNQLKDLVAAAKEHGLKFICEYVPNHLAPDAPFISSEQGLVYLDDNKQPLYDQDWSDTVKLNHQNPAIQGFTRANLTWLIKTYGFNGFRLDMAHYPLQGTQKQSSFGSGEPNFWKEVFNNPVLTDPNNIWIAEVYDDRTQDEHGYADHLRLLKQGIQVYDKKTHDIFSRKLKYGANAFNLQDKFYEELFVQAQVAHSVGIDTRLGSVPFLRMPSNHDDCPGFKNYGGTSEFILACGLLCLLPGHAVIYAGEEYGLKTKPSIVGINYCDEQGNMTESNQLKLLPEADQQRVHNSLKTVLNLRKTEPAFQKGALLMPKVLEANGALSPDLLSFVRYVPANHEIIVVAANLNKTGPKAWGRLYNFYPTFDFPTHEFIWTELLEWVNPNLVKAGYKVLNLATRELSETRKFNDEFWIGLAPLEMQVLKIVSSK